MAEQEIAPKVLSLDELLGFREATERVSGFLNQRLKDHLTALSPLLVPGRVLGKHVGARESAPRADEALADLSEKYKQVCGSLSGLKPDLDEDVLAAIGSAIQAYPYEYGYEAKGAKASRQIAMTSPIRWVVSYGAGGSLSQMRTQLLNATDRRTPPVRQFVVNALAFQVTLGRSPGAAHLVQDLRYEIRTQDLPGLEGLPLMTFSVPLPSFRPADDLLLTATRLSGVPAFIEVIDREAVRSLQDPLRLQIEALLQEPA
ncbi:MAG TPA: hypothetical protein VGZ73_19710 [Bryobacteraceae bacterium]|jgi:hypothetical protein|nr:hypothetical protein [Bryobacteraceae bacterium]